MCDFCNRSGIIFSTKKTTNKPLENGEPGKIETGHSLTIEFLLNNRTISITSGRYNKDWSWLGHDIKILYCPKCGRKLTKE